MLVVVVLMAVVSPGSLAAESEIANLKPRGEVVQPYLLIKEAVAGAPEGAGDDDRGKASIFEFAGSGYSEKNQEEPLGESDPCIGPEQPWTCLELFTKSSQSCHHAATILIYIVKKTGGYK
jgi:hypothetical protein